MRQRDERHHRAEAVLVDEAGDAAARPDSARRARRRVARQLRRRLVADPSPATVASSVEPGRRAAPRSGSRPATCGGARAAIEAVDRVERALVDARRSTAPPVCVGELLQRLGLNFALSIAIA